MTIPSLVTEKQLMRFALPGECTVRIFASRDLTAQDLAGLIVMLEAQISVLADTDDSPKAGG